MNPTKLNPIKRFESNKRKKAKIFLQKYDLLREFEKIIERHQIMIDHCFIEPLAIEYVTWLFHLKE